MTDIDHDDVVRLRAALARISRRLDRNVSGGGLTRTQLSVLASVSLRGPIASGELADHEGMNPTMLSRILTKLETAELVRRTPDPEDGRSVLVEVTRGGTALHQRIRDERAKLLADRLAGLPPARVKALLAALPALDDLAEALRPEGGRA